MTDITHKDFPTHPWNLSLNMGLANKKGTDQPAHMFVCFVTLRPKSTAMVMVGRSVHLTTLFPGQA